MANGSQDPHFNDKSLHSTALKNKMILGESLFKRRGPGGMGSGEKSLKKWSDLMPINVTRAHRKIELNSFKIQPCCR